MVCRSARRARPAALLIAGTAAADVRSTGCTSKLTADLTIWNDDRRRNTTRRIPA